MNLYADTVGTLQTWLFEQAVQPALFAVGAMHLAEKAYDATEWFILGGMEIAVLFALLRPMEAWRPAEVWRNRDGVGTDVIYTFLGRLGVVPMTLFFMLTPMFDWFEAELRLAGFSALHLEDLAPAISASPALSFALYFVVLDLAEYWRHRLQHRFDWWWALHALHHSQRKMSFWADSRNHLLDDVLAGMWTAAIALIIGIPPGQFFLIIIAARMIESLSHANVRLGFGALGKRLMVSPHFHRLHHAVGVGHEGAHQGCNFAVLMPVWDIVFRTANFASTVEPTGVRDQLSGRDYGRGFWAQQGLGLHRMWQALSRARSRV